MKGMIAQKPPLHLHQIEFLVLMRHLTIDLITRGRLNLRHLLFTFTAVILVGQLNRRDQMTHSEILKRCY